MPDKFSNIMDKTSEEVLRSTAVPTGTYTLAVKSVQKRDSREKKTPHIALALLVRSPGADVDMDEVESREIDFSSQTVYENFYLTDKALYRIFDFAENQCGIDMGEMSLLELLGIDAEMGDRLLDKDLSGYIEEVDLPNTQLVGHEFDAYLVEKTNKNGKTYNEIQRFVNMN